MAKWSTVAAPADKPRPRWAPVDSPPQEPAEGWAPPTDEMNMDQGPPSVGVPESALRPSPRQASIGNQTMVMAVNPLAAMFGVPPTDLNDANAVDARAAGTVDALPFARNLDAATAAAARAAKGDRWAQIVNEYRRAKNNAVAEAETARERAPGEYYKGMVPAAAGVAFGAGAAGAAMPALGAEVTTAALKAAPELAALVGQVDNYGDAGPSDVTAALVGGKVIASAPKVALGVLKGVAVALGVPLNVAESLFMRFGATRLGKMIAGNDPTPEGKVISKRAAELKQKISDAESFQGTPAPKIEAQTPDDFRALELADQVEKGNAQILPGEGNYSADPSIEGGMYDDSLRAAMKKHVPDFDPTADLGGELDRVKYPDMSPPAAKSQSSKAAQSTFDDISAGAGEDVPTKIRKKGSGAAPEASAAPEGMPSGAGSFKSNREAWQRIVEASGVDDTVSDLQTNRHGQYDEIEQIIGRPVKNAKDAFDGLVKVSAAKRGRMRQPYDWEDVQTAVRELRKVDGLEDLQLPADVQERLLPHERAPSEVSFSPEKMDRELQEYVAPVEQDAVIDPGPSADPEALGAAGDAVTKYRTPSGREKEAPLRDVVEGDAQKLEWRDKLDRGDAAKARPRVAGADDNGEAAGDYQRSVARRAARWDELGGVGEEAAAEQAAAGPEKTWISPETRSEQWQAVKRDAKTGMREREIALVSKAREYRALMAQADAIESQNKMEAARLRALADDALIKLNDLSRGRRAAEKVAGAVAGWKAGSAGGILGQMGTAAAGYKLGVPVGRVADVSSAAGQKLAAWAAAHADQWASRGDDLGRIAQWAMSSTGAPADLRMFLLGRAARELQIEQ